MIRARRALAVARLACLIAALGGCDTLKGALQSSKTTEIGHTPGKRETVLTMGDQIAPDSTLSDASIALPPEKSGADWPFAGGPAGYAAENPALASALNRIWTRDIGRGSGSNLRLLARPVVAEERVFAMDARGDISALNAQTGEALWKTETKPEDADESAMGGGVAVQDGVVYAATGYGEILALKAEDGSVLWRHGFGDPFRGAPVVAEERVFAVSISNQVQAVSARDGSVLWHHSGINESAALMGATSPAIVGDTVVVAYSSGEIFVLRAQNGRVGWGDMLSVPAQVGALPAMSDIRGLPVVDQGGVFAISHSGPLAAISLRSGDRAWDVDVGGANTPCVAGDTVFVLSNDNKLLAMTRKNGRVIWAKDLQRLEDPEDHDSDPVIWSGPVLAGGRLFMVNSLEKLVEFSPTDGVEGKSYDLPAKAYIAPVVAHETLYVLTDDGDLAAFR